MSDKKPHKYLGPLLLLVFAVAVALGAVVYRQDIIDHVRAAQYQPAAAVKHIRGGLGLTGEGELYFDASQPEIESAGAFNDDCRQEKETNNPILGCYVDQRIYIFDVTNKELEGIEETTAAHELLHAAYERLSPGARRTLNAELEAAYQRVKTPELEQRIDFYKRSEPGQEMNELHSILGTEVDGLGSALEKHYSEFFKDRQKVLSYYHTYSAVFEDATKQLKRLENQINTRTDDINDRIKSYNKAVAALKDDVEVFNRRSQQNGGFSSQAEFDNARAGLLARQNDLDKTREAINDDIKSVERLRTNYNDLVDKYNELSRSINSSLPPTPKL